MKNKTGFTLIEMAITVAIIGIIATIAAASYKTYVLKGQRTDGKNVLISLALLEEHYRINNRSYGTLAQLSASSFSPKKFYTLSISDVTATSYTLTATAIGNQVHDTQDSISCTPLVITVNNGTQTQTPDICWSS